MHVPFLPTPYLLMVLRARIDLVDCLTQLLLYTIGWLEAVDGQGCRKYFPGCCESSFFVIAAFSRQPR